MQNEMSKQLILDFFENKVTATHNLVRTIQLPSTKNKLDGKVIIFPKFFDRRESDRFFDKLHRNLIWRQDQIRVFGKEIRIPRLNAWYGDEGKTYTYSGNCMSPLPWTPALILIKEKIEQEIGLNFNSVLANQYRDGKDSVSWHSDDEPELGINPVIASVSFGETRRFQLRHKSNKELEKIEIALTHGSLLIMKGTTQHYWKHQIPKTAKNIGARINLTFRMVN